MAKTNNVRKLLSILIIIYFSLTIFPAYRLQNDDNVLNPGESYSGFKLSSKKYIDELRSYALMFNHIKSGARLFYLQNYDDNKVFSIAFKTPAKDNTGVNHIIEHSVLDGSLNYPVKSPLSEMSKRSLNTYLNAYTASDRTVFPVASRNEKDFENLMNVYLDAVFFPQVINDKKIFLQEAGHYELDSSSSKINFKGVVYNEMKGNQSSPSTILGDEINKSLFPDTQYKWNPGGTPEAIRTLTWEKLKEVYNRNYKPSNSYIYIYGDVNIKKILRNIDGNYLSKFSNSPSKITIDTQVGFNEPRTVIANYPVPRGADMKNKTFLSVNFVIDRIANKDDAVGLMFLDYLLLGNNGSPLKKALLKAGIGSNVYSSINNYNLQTSYSVIAENANSDQRDEFIKVINMVLKNLLRSGLDRNTLSAQIHSYEIKLRAHRSDANRGIIYNDLAMSTWINEGDPTLYLTLNDSLDKLKRAHQDNYFEGFITKYLLNNRHSSIVVLKPSSALSEKAEAEADEDSVFRDRSVETTREDMEKLINETKEIKKWQSTPNPRSAMDKLPSLSVMDINRRSEITPMEVTHKQGAKLLKHQLYTDKIIYSDLYFDTSGVPQSQIKYLYLLSMLLGGLDTGKYSHTELADVVGNNMGSISFTPMIITKQRDMNTYYPKLDISFYTLEGSMDSSLKVVDEIINSTKYDNVELIGQYIKMLKASLDNHLIGSGLEVVSCRLHSYYSEAGKYGDMGGFPFYSFITELANSYESKANEISRNLMEVSKIVFNRRNLVASVTCDANGYKEYEKAFEGFARGLRDNNIPKQCYKFKKGQTNEGFMTSSKVQYIAQGYDYTKLGYGYSGKMLVLKNILDGDYIWNKVRELGGAYGGTFSITSNGNAVFLSWRDPNLKETLQVFGEAHEFIDKFTPSKGDMDNYIISTIGDIDRPLSPSEKGRNSDIDFFSGTKPEDIQRERDEILSTTSDDIKGYADMLKKITEQKKFCVFGNSTKIRENKDIFDFTIDIMK